MDFKHFKPCFLIAMPELTDPNFEKTVILLTDYNETGSGGFIINRNTEITLGESVIIPDGNLNPDYSAVVLWSGGPVELEKIWIVYDGKVNADPEDSDIGDNIHIAHDINILINHEKTININRLRIYHGFSGWSAGQLESEFALNMWITSDLSQDLIFDTPPEKIWEQAIKKMGIDPYSLKGTDSTFLN